MLAEITNSPRGANAAAAKSAFSMPPAKAPTTLSRSSSAKKLTQRRSSSSHFKAGLCRETEVELVFGADGPLGFTFVGCGSSGAEVITVAGQAVSNGLQRGDEITAVNGRCIAGIEHDEVAEMLKNAPRPCTLSVQRVQSVVDIEASSEEATMGKVVRQGHLSKLNSKNIWQGRTFHLNSTGELRYYSGSGSKARLGGLIELTQCFGLEATDKKIRIKWDEKGENTIALRAPSKTKAAAWVSDMEEVLDFIWSCNYSPQKGSRAEEQAKAREYDATFLQRRHKLKMATALTSNGVPHIRSVVSDESLREAGSSLGSEEEFTELTPIFDGSDYSIDSYHAEPERTYRNIEWEDVDTCSCSFSAHIMRARSARVDGILRRSRSCSRAPVADPVPEHYPTFTEDELVDYVNSNPLWWQRLLGKCSAIPKDTTESSNNKVHTITGKETRNRRRSTLTPTRLFSSQRQREGGAVRGVAN